MTFEEVMDGLLFNESTSELDKKKDSKERIESEVKETQRNLKDIIEKKYPGKHKRIEIVDNHIACCSEETEKHYKFKRLYYIDDDGKIVGSLTMHAEENLIANLFIEKKYRRKGYASKLIECAVNKYGMKHLRVFKNNTNAIALYKKLGYTEEPKDPKLTYNDKMYYKEIKGPIKIEKESVNESEDLDYLSYFTEGSNDLIYHNFEDFKSGKCNFCFVTGLSGSGKSTLAKQLAEKYNAEYIELDLFHFALHKKDPRTMPSPIFYEYLKRHKDVWDIFKDKEKRQALTGTELGNYLADFIEYTVDYAKRHPNKKFIIEGVQIFSLRNPARFENYPLIIINRSITRSFVQRLGREINKPEDIVKQIKRTPKYINFYKDDRKNLDDFIQYFNESEDLDYLSYFIEATDNTYYIKDEIYPIVEKVLSTQMGDRAFRRLVEKFIDKNGPKLLTIGPVHMVPFADKDKAEFYKLFNTNETELKESIKKMTTHVNDKANWKLITQNPIFCLFYCCIRYYTVKKDTKGKDIALIIYALAAYPSIFYNYFQYGANPGVMQYTIDNMTQKFIIKNEGHIFGTLRKSISNSWEFHKDYFEDMCDKEVIRFIQRIRNDQNSLLKKIANEYYKNYEKGLTVKKTVDKFDDNAVVDDILNNTSVVEDISRKIVNGMMTGGVNLRLAEIAAKICQISVVDSRFYITKIMVEKNTEKLQKFIESILFIYLYDENHTTQDINSGYFISKFAPELFKKTNSNNPNIKFIKKTLDEWAEESGVHDQFKREASRVNYKKAIYFYIILSIQSYSN